MKDKHYLVASDFDQTLSFNDSGFLLSELLGISNFHEKVDGLSQINLVQQGAELSYLILHDPAFRKVRRDQLAEAGKRVRLKKNVALFVQALNTLAEGYEQRSAGSRGGIVSGGKRGAASGKIGATPRHHAI